jgi:hypothetical protein
VRRGAPAWAVPILEAVWTIRATRAQLRALDNAVFKKFARSTDFLVFGVLVVISMTAWIFPPLPRVLIVLAAAAAGVAYISKVGRVLLAERRRRGGSGSIRH